VPAPHTLVQVYVVIVCNVLSLVISLGFIFSAVIDLYDGPPVAGAVVPEVAPSSSGPSVPPAPLALEVEQPPAALTWEGDSEPVEALPTELEVTEPEPELPSPTAVPRRMTLSWRELLPRFFYSKAAYPTLCGVILCSVGICQADFTLNYLLG